MRRLVVAGAALLLAGCASPAPRPSPTASDPVPAFPAVPGPVVDRSMPAAEDWVIRVRVDDADRAYADARRRLVEGGFMLTKDREGRGGGDGQACTGDLCVAFSATEGADGATVAYEVFRNGGIIERTAP